MHPHLPTLLFLHLVTVSASSDLGYIIKDGQITPTLELMNDACAELSHLLIEKIISKHHEDIYFQLILGSVQAVFTYYASSLQIQQSSPKFSDELYQFLLLLKMGCYVPFTWTSQEAKDRLERLLPWNIKVLDPNKRQPLSLTTSRQHRYALAVAKSKGYTTVTESWVMEWFTLEFFRYRQKEPVNWTNALVALVEMIKMWSRKGLLDALQTKRTHFTAAPTSTSPAVWSTVVPDESTDLWEPTDLSKVSSTEFAGSSDKRLAASSPGTSTSARSCCLVKCDPFIILVGLVVAIAWSLARSKLPPNASISPGLTNGTILSFVRPKWIAVVGVVVGLILVLVAVAGGYYFWWRRRRRRRAVDKVTLNEDQMILKRRKKRRKSTLGSKMTSAFSSVVSVIASPSSHQKLTSRVSSIRTDPIQQTKINSRSALSRYFSGVFTKNTGKNSSK